MHAQQQDRLARIVAEVLDANEARLGATYISSAAIREALVTIIAMSVEADSPRSDADIRARAQRTAYQLREDILPFLSVPA